MGRSTPAGSGAAARCVFGLGKAAVCVFIGAAGLAMWSWATTETPAPIPGPACAFPLIYRDGVPVMPEDLDR